MKFGILLSLLLLFVSPSLGCDSNFLQEPTTREPDSVQYDTISELAYVTYNFIDGRTLVAVYQMPDVLSEPEEHPLFYIVIQKDHTSVTYIDPEGKGHCYDIRRY